MNADTASAVRILEAISSRIACTVSDSAAVIGTSLSQGATCLPESVNSQTGRMFPSIQ